MIRPSALRYAPPALRRPTLAVALGLGAAAALGTASLPAPAGAQVLDPSLLQPTTWTYRIVYADDRLGTVERVIDHGEEEGTFVLRTEASAPGTRAVERVVFRAATFAPLEATARVRALGRGRDGNVTLERGRLTGRISGPDGDFEVEEDVPAGTLLGDMAEVALWISGLREGAELDLRVVEPDEGRVRELRARVLGRTTVTVPAGTFEAWEVELAGPRGRRTLHLRVEAPHVTLRAAVEGEPATLLLETAP